MKNSLPSKPKRKRRIHRSEFKAKVVALCQEPNVSRAEIARRFDLNDNLVHKWCVEAKRKGIANQSPEFIQLPAPRQTETTFSQTYVTFDYTTDKGRLTVKWPMSEIEHSVLWIKALGL